MNFLKDLYKLGFTYKSDINIYETEEKKLNKHLSNKKSKDSVKTQDLLYKKTITCPVCKTVFKALAVKSSSYRAKSRDSDLFIRYSLINPYFYDAWVCEHCGYSAMKSDFLKIRTYEIDLIKDKICSRWKSKYYPDEYNVEIAIERYKLCLLNAIESKSKSSKKAMICLKLAWMYRISESKESAEKELFFLEQAVKGFEYAYINEITPIYGMDISTIMYLIGELYRRIGNYEASLSWFSKVIVIPGIRSSLKELARTQKDLCINEKNKDT